jgi:hypothetical protein
MVSPAIQRGGRLSVSHGISGICVAVSRVNSFSVVADGPPSLYINFRLTRETGGYWWVGRLTKIPLPEVYAQAISYPKILKSLKSVNI